jgi:peptide/nickel transport system substrate-binding protein
MQRRSVAVTVALLVASACTSGAEEPASPSQADTTPSGGTLRIAVEDFSAAVNFDVDPQRGYTNATFALGRCCLFRTLYSYNGRPTEEGGTELHPDLAAGKPRVSSDGLTWTFRIAPALRYAAPFEDSTITSRDLVRALERTARVGGYAFYYEVIRGFGDYASGEADSIVGLETPDDRTLVVRLEQVTGDLAYLFSLPATSPIPEGAADGHDKDYARFLVASGPYMVEGSEALDPSAPPRQQEPLAGYVPPNITRALAVEEPGMLTLVRNPSWEPRTDRLRPAYADRIEITLGGADADIARQVNTGAADLSFTNHGAPFNQVARYEEDPGLEDRVKRNARDLISAVTMNLAAPPFDDVHVRRAVGLAIDKEAQVALLAGPPHDAFSWSWAEVATHIAPDGLQDRLLGAFDPYPFDPGAARAEMAASAYDRDGDGRCDAAACRGVRALVLDEGVAPKQARAIRGDLAEVGIQLTLDPVSVGDFFGFTDLGGTFAGSINDPRARIPIGISVGWQQDYPEGGGWFQGLFDGAALEVSNTALVGASPAQLEEWGYTVTTVPGVDDRLRVCLERRGGSRTQCWAELDQYLMTEVVPWVPIMIGETAVVVSERVVAYSFDQFSQRPALDRIALAPGSD